MTARRAAAEQKLLLCALFLSSLCGIVYELVLGSLATYLLGNPVSQYSITIGVFLFAMGAGSYLSRFLEEGIVRAFIFIEAALGLTGGVSVLCLNFFFSFTASYYALHVFFVAVIGGMVGFEIPLLVRALKRHGELKAVIANVLALDYMGGLAGSLLFPLLMFPHLGRFLTSIVIGVMNIGAAVALIAYVDYPGKRRSDALFPLAAIALLLILAVFSGEITHALQQRLYADDIVFSRRSRCQEIVLTRGGDDFRLYLDGSLQFSTSDEYRYHEMLVHPALALLGAREKSVLILGGGDGLALREALRDPLVTRAVLVELDPEMIMLARENSSFVRINAGSLHDPRARVVTGDAYAYLRGDPGTYDCIIADFSDPHDETISKLYTVEFYRLVKRALTEGGVFVTQSTSPLSARDAFWCVSSTLRQVFPHVLPYHVMVPSFGDWGFNLASESVIDPEKAGEGPAGLRYYARASFLAALHFPRDSGENPVRVNTFDCPVLYTYYLKGWKYSE